MAYKTNDNLKAAKEEYKKHFEGGSAISFYTTGDPDRDAAIIRECIRLNTPIWLPPVDGDSEDAKMAKAERKRLHALVP